MKAPKKDWKFKVIEIVIFIFLMVIGFFALFSDVFAAEGFFGDPDEWSHWDSRQVRKICAVICIPIWYLLITFMGPERRAEKGLAPISKKDWIKLGASSVIILVSFLIWLFHRIQ